LIKSTQTDLPAAFEAGVRFHMSDPTQAELCASQGEYPLELADTVASNASTCFYSANCIKTASDSEALASPASAPAHTPSAMGTSNSAIPCVSDSLRQDSPLRSRNEPMRIMREGGYQKAWRLGVSKRGR
jgi:hypothetical protein